MTLPNLRPLSFGEILDGAFTLYRRNFRLFIGTSFVLMAGLVVGAAVLGGTGVAMASVMPGPIAFVVLLMVAVAILALVTMLWSTLTWQAARSYLGKPVSLGDGVSAAGGAAMTLVGAMLIAALTFLAMMIAVWIVAITLGAILAALGITALAVLAGILVVVGVGAAFFFVAALFFGVFPAVMMEEKGPVDAVSRSVQLARGALPRIAGMLFVTLVIVSLPSLAIEALTGGFRQLSNPGAAQAAQTTGSVLLEQLLAWTVAVLTTPFLPSVLVMLYYDRRVRTEALDVEILTDQLRLAGA
jgi:hypothetical protein